MSDFGFSDYHPSWESQEFTKDQYLTVLQEIASKSPHDSLINSDHKIKVASRIMHLWQVIKGWLGFENLTDPIKVNYTLLKLLRYGEVHHFFNNHQIRELLTGVQKTLAIDPNHSKIAEIINRSLNLNSTEAFSTENFLNKEISTYYQAHESHFQEFSWSKLFNRHIHLSSYNKAVIDFNKGRILANDGKPDEGLKKIEEAIKQCPEKLDWHYEYALQAQKLVKEQIQDRKYSEALELCKKGKLVLFSLKELDCDQLFQDEISSGVALFASIQASLDINEGRFEAALKNLIDCKEKFVTIDFFAALKEILGREKVFKIDHFKLAEFYSFCAYHPNFLLEKPSLLKNALEELSKNKIFDPLHTFQKSISIQSDLAEHYLINSHPHEALKVLDQILTNILAQDNSCTLPELKGGRLKTLSDLLVATFVKNNNLESLLGFLEKANQIWPKDWNILLYLSKSYSSLKQWDRSVNTAKLLIELQTDFYTKKSQALYNLASIYAKQEKTVEAIAETKKALQIDPENIEALELLFELTGDLGGTHEYERILEKKPDDPRLHIKIGIAYLTQKNYRNAHRHLEKAEQYISKLSKTSQDELFAAIGKLYFEEKDFEKSLSYYAKVSEKGKYKSELSACHIGIAENALPDKNFRQFIKSYQNALQIDPTSTSACRLIKSADELFFDQSTDQFFYNKTEYACQAYNLALPYLDQIRDKNKLIDINLRLATVAKNKNYLELAIKHLETARKLDPANNQVIKELSTCYSLAGKFDAAEALLNSSKQTNKTEFYVLQAKAYEKKGMLEQALQAYEKASDSRESDKQQYNQEKIKLLLKMAENETSTFPLNTIKYYEKALLLSDNKVDICNLLLNVANKQKNINPPFAFKIYKLAIPHLSSTFDQNQKSQIIKFLVDISINDENYAEAAQFASEGLRLEPDNVPLLIQYALASRRLKQFENAEKALLRASSLSPANPGLTTRLAEIYRELGKPERAVELYREVISNFSPQRTEWLKNLYESDIEAGDLNFELGLFEPHAIDRQTIDFVTLALNSQRDEITKALGYYKSIFSNAENSDKNKKLISLQQPKKSAAEIAHGCLTAIELIELAYDGKFPHLRPEDMPSRIQMGLQKLKMNQKTINQYYSLINSSTQALANLSNEVRKTDIKINETLSDPIEIEKQALKILQTIESSYKGWFSSTPIPEKINSQIKNLQSLLSTNPQEFMSKACDYYKEALHLNPNLFNPFMNRLVHALVSTKQSNSAIQYYEMFQKKFSYNIELNPNIYIAKLEALLATKYFQDAINLMQTLINIYPGEEQFKKGLSHTYFVIGENYRQKLDINQALHFYELATNCNIEAEAACYHKLGSTYQERFKTTNDINYLNLAEQNLLLAAKIDSNNLDYTLDLATFFFEERNRHPSSLPMFEKAKNIAINRIKNNQYVGNSQLDTISVHLSNLGKRLVWDKELLQIHKRGPKFPE